MGVLDFLSDLLHLVNLTKQVNFQKLLRLATFYLPSTHFSVEALILQCIHSCGKTGDAGSVITMKC